MKYRIVNILEPEDLGASGTKVIDIKLLDVISRLSIIFLVHNGADGLSDHVAANVSKIELIDGSEVLFSLSGKQAQAVSFYQTGRMPWNYLNASSGHYQTAQFDLNFGRYLYDPELAFDPKKFRNPQLRITFNEAVSQTDATENSCRVVGYVFDEVQPSVVGMLRAMEQYIYGLTAGTKAYIDMPTDHVLKEVYVSCLEKSGWHMANVDHYKISEENGKRIPVDIDYTPLAFAVMERYGWICEGCRASGVVTYKNFYTAISEYAFAQSAVETEQQHVSIQVGCGGEHSYKTEFASGKAFLSIEGLLPHGVMPVLNLLGNDMDSWYDVINISNLELILSNPSGATASQIVEILTEQFYRY